MYDVCIIGAGAVGMNIARELAKYNLTICVLDKGEDVSSGCSKANSGIVHGGYSDEPGTLKAEFCVKGNRMYEQLNRELNFGYRKTGSLVLAFSEEDLPRLEKLYRQGIANGVIGLEIISGDKARQLEPYISTEVVGALYCENAGIISPYEFVIALAENAVENGVELRLQTEVLEIAKQQDHFKITVTGGAVSARYVINCAGVHSDEVARMVGIDDYQIVPRRGQYVLLDKEQNYLVKSVIFQVPTKLGKGILVTATYHGNLMIGPNAEATTDKEDVGTDEKALEYIVQSARKSVPNFDMRKALTSFSGNRPISNKEDFIIEESRIKQFINLIGIDSPGLTSSPAIALKVIHILRQAGLKLQEKAAFQPYRKPIIQKKADDFAGSTESTDPNTHIICRCEQVTEAEIIDSLHRGIPVTSVDGIKRRTRAGMGRCQGAFCGPRVRQLVAQELNIPIEEVKQTEKVPSQLFLRAKRGDMIKMQEHKEPVK